MFNPLNFTTMPNWCMTSYVIVGKTEDIEKINNAVESHPVKERSDKNWQGNILAALGIDYEDLEKFDVRGFLVEHDYIVIGHEESQLKLLFEEAWSRTEFAELLQELFPEIDIYWAAEEPGCEIYETNDREGGFFPDRYFIDAYINGDYQSDYFETKEEALKFVAMISDCKNEDDIEAFNENHNDTDEYIYVHEFDVV